MIIYKKFPNLNSSFRKLYKIYIPRTQMSLVLIGKGLVLWGGWHSKIEVIWVLGMYIYIYIFVYFVFEIFDRNKRISSDAPPQKQWQVKVSRDPLIQVLLQEGRTPTHHTIGVYNFGSVFYSFTTYTTSQFLMCSSSPIYLWSFFWWWHVRTPTWVRRQRRRLVVVGRSSSKFGASRLWCLLEPEMWKKNIGIRLVRFHLLIDL